MSDKTEPSDDFTPTTAYVRDAFISERLRDQGIPESFEAIAREQEAWHRFRAGVATHNTVSRPELTKALSLAKALSGPADNWGYGATVDALIGILAALLVPTSKEGAK